MRKLFLIVWALVAFVNGIHSSSASAQTKFSPELEFKVRPLVRSMGLELALRMPTKDALSYADLTEDRAMLVDRLRLELVKDLQPIQANSTLVKGMEVVAAMFLQRVVHTAQSSESGEQLFKYAVSYLRDHASGRYIVEWIKQDIEMVEREPQLQPLRSWVLPLLKEALVASQSRPEQANDILDFLDSLDSNQKEVVEDRASDLVEPLLIAAARRISCELGLTTHP